MFFLGLINDGDDDDDDNDDDLAPCRLTAFPRRRWREFPRCSEVAAVLFFGPESLLLGDGDHLLHGDDDHLLHGDGDHLLHGEAEAAVLVAMVRVWQEQLDCLSVGRVLLESSLLEKETCCQCCPGASRKCSHCFFGLPHAAPPCLQSFPSLRRSK